jgi:hypothetical protein
MGEAPEGMSLDRIDVNGDYSPDNCRWATHAQQMRNTRFNIRLTLNGRTQCLVDWAKELGIKRATIQKRLKSGYSDEEALSTEPFHRRKGRRQSSVTTAQRAH